MLCDKAAAEEIPFDAASRGIIIISASVFRPSPPRTQDPHTYILSPAPAVPTAGGISSPSIQPQLRHEKPQPLTCLIRYGTTHPSASPPRDLQGALIDSACAFPIYSSSDFGAVSFDNEVRPCGIERLFPMMTASRYQVSNRLVLIIVITATPSSTLRGGNRKGLTRSVDV